MKVTILNVENQYVRKVKIGKFGICEINHTINVEDTIFLYTKYKEILYLKNKKEYDIEVENQRKRVWICQIISFKKFLKMTSSDKKLVNEDNIEEVDIIYGRCKKSMSFLDKVHRKYIDNHPFKKNEIIAIKSVAGSGKTTTLINLAKIHSDKKILYTAFNKSLIMEICEKNKSQNITNLYPKTFDALMREIFISHKKNFILTDLKSHNLQNFIPWFKKKSFKIKEFYVRNYIKFCRQEKHDNIEDYCKESFNCKKPLLENMWEKTLKGELITFDSIRKIIQINHWGSVINNKYHMVFIDEAQDFDNIMLEILLKDTTLPKLFVGDPLQAIYEWRGCIDAFKKLPLETLFIEFYSTFRIGEPACSQITNKFDNCWMITKSDSDTDVTDIIPSEKYVYLFRSWKFLLQAARNINNIWIYNYDKQIEYIKKLHYRLQTYGELSKEEMSKMADDLPKFLFNLEAEELEELIDDIECNVVDRKNAKCEMFTIHSYKGLENNSIRICNDINKESEKNIYYVALTRGIKEIILD